MANSGALPAREVVRLAILMGVVGAALVFTFIYGPLAGCGGPECVPPAPQMFHHLETVNTPLVRKCACNVSTEIRQSPNPRTLSNDVFAQTEEMPDARGLSTAIMLMGQFTDHDIVLTSSDTVTPPISVPIPQPDPFFPPSLVEINVTRSSVVTDAGGCPVQVSSTTSIVDGSQIYGVSHGKLQALRSFKGGRLRVGKGNLLPPTSPEDPTWLVGDPRATEWAGLAAMHTLWVREHNHWADRLQHIHPLWTDGEVFWKARQFVVVEWQSIVYNEYLPALLGTSLYESTVDMAAAALDESTPPAVWSEFSVVAFRMGHSQVPDVLGGDTPLSDVFGAAGIANINANGIEGILRRVFTTPAETVNTHFVDDIRNLLHGELGQDLALNNIVRAREMRIEDYGSLRNCFRGPGLPIDTSDPLQGVLAEEHAEGSSVGPTAGIIIGKQFRHLRDANSGFYLFKKAKIGTRFYDELVSATLRRIVLRNTKLTFVNLPHSNLFFVP